MSRSVVFRFLLFSTVLVAGTPVFSQEIKIGTSSEPSSVDPHYHVVTPNEQLRKHIFEALTGYDDNRRIIPILAESWKTIGPKTWEFKLRSGVKFSDGSPFTAQDVIYSLCRVSKVANSPGPFTTFTRHIVSAKATDPQTLILDTSIVYPLLPNDLVKVGIISAKLNNGESVKYGADACAAPSWPTSKEFNSGKLAVGTGPYKLGEFVPGSRVVLNRNDQYWGAKPKWVKATFRPILSEGPRVAALLSGDLDLIEAPPSQDLPRIQSDPRLKIHSAKSARVTQIRMDSGSQSNPAVSGAAKNPFKDKRVREALSRAVDRYAIAEKIMGGFAVPAWQLLYGGGDEKIKGWYNPAKAKELLAQAGYPNGFELTLSGPNDRFVNDARITQAVAQMFSAVGIKTRVNLMPANIYFSKQSKGELGVWTASWLVSSGELSYPLRSLLATPNKEKGYGAANFSKYSNVSLDTLLDEAMETMDHVKRQKILQQASDLAIEDFALIPLHYEVNLWAMKKDIEYKGRWDQETSVPEIK
jgi:peptide/nickel transport system substrate-binding protein